MSLTLFLGLNSISQTIDLATVAELACHKVDKLAISGKIDGNFKNQLNSLQISILEKNPQGEKYLVTVFQNPPLDKSKFPLSIELYLDSKGKTLRYTTAVLHQGEKGVDVLWPDLDPDSLLENVLHYLLHHGASTAELTPFLTNLNSLTIVQEIVNGQTIAKVTITSQSTLNVLEFTLKLDGTVIEYKIK